MPAQRKYPEELRERAVKMVLEIRDREGKGRGEIARVGRQLGVHPEALRGGSGRPKSMVGRGRAPRLRIAQRIAELEREIVSSAGRMRY